MMEFRKNKEIRECHSCYFSFGFDCIQRKYFRLEKVRYSVFESHSWNNRYIFLMVIHRAGRISIKYFVFSHFFKFSFQEFKNLFIIMAINYLLPLNSWCLVLYHFLYVQSLNVNPASCRPITQPISISISWFVVKFEKFSRNEWNIWVLRNVYMKKHPLNFIFHNLFLAILSLFNQ